MNPSPELIEKIAQAIEIADNERGDFEWAEHLAKAAHATIMKHDPAILKLVEAVRIGGSTWGYHPGVWEAIEPFIPFIEGAK